MAKEVEVGGTENSPRTITTLLQHPLRNSPVVILQGPHSVFKFIAKLLFLYILVVTVIGYKSQTRMHANGDECGDIGILAIAGLSVAYIQH